MFRTQTITQAAILAARVGLLTNAPLTKADILVGSSRVPANRVVTTPNAASMRRLIKMRNVAPGDPDTPSAIDWHPRLLLSATSNRDGPHPRPLPRHVRRARQKRTPAAPPATCATKCCAGTVSPYLNPMLPTARRLLKTYPCRTARTARQR